MTSVDKRLSMNDADDDDVGWIVSFCCCMSLTDGLLLDDVDDEFDW